MLPVNVPPAPPTPYWTLLVAITPGSVVGRTDRAVSAHVERDLAGPGDPVLLKACHGDVGERDRACCPRIRVGTDPVAGLAARVLGDVPNNDVGRGAVGIVEEESDLNKLCA